MSSFVDSGKLRYAAARMRAATLRVLGIMPELSSIAHDTFVEVDEGRMSFAMSRDGVLRAPLRDALTLSEPDLDFVVAHELLHRAYRHHLRGEGCDVAQFNMAADLVINEALVGRLGHEPPLGGLRDPSVSNRSVEAVCLRLRHEGVPISSKGDLDPSVQRPTCVSRKSRRRPVPRDDASGVPRAHDLGDDVCIRREVVDLDVCDPIDALEVGGHAFRQWTTVVAESADASFVLRALPWTTSPATWVRTFGRRSRRQAAVRDESVVLAGRKRPRERGLHIIVDVSLSCTLSLGRFFGLAADLLVRSGIGAADVVLTDGEWVEQMRGATAESLRKVSVPATHGPELHLTAMPCRNCFRPRGLRLRDSSFGSLAPAFLALESACASRAVVFTDGLIAPPASGGIDDVVYVVESLHGSRFRPAVGRVIRMPSDPVRQEADP